LGAIRCLDSLQRTVLYMYDIRRVLMLAIRLPAEIEQRLDALAKRTGRSKSYYARAAIVEYMGDLDDRHLAGRRLNNLRDDRRDGMEVAEPTPSYGSNDAGKSEEARMQLTAVLIPAEEGGFVALNPETGTASQGDSIADALANLREATELYLEEFPIASYGKALLTTFEVAARAA
jgi:predicted DNA-binding protein/predicted RNase H-like HicB family nuclease